MFPPVATRGFRRRLLGTVAPPQQRVWLRVRAVDGADHLTACWHSAAFWHTQQHKLIKEFHLSLASGHFPERFNDLAVVAANTAGEMYFLDRSIRLR